MFPSIITLLLTITLVSQLIIEVNAEGVDEIVRQCQRNRTKFKAEEDKYAKKSPRLIVAPEFFDEPFIEEQDIYLHKMELSQKDFECIADNFQVFTDEKLQNSRRYQLLKRKCKAVQPVKPKCDQYYPYRIINGTCNNLYKPRWGSTFSCFRRIWPASYEGVAGLRKSVVEKKDLPNPREISRALIQWDSKPVESYNALFAYFGQPIAHDLAMFPFSMVNGTTKLGCCENLSKGDQHPQCIPIELSLTDLFYSLQGIRCHNVPRVVPCDTCSLGKRIPINYLTAWLDLSFVYGHTDARSKKLRRFDGTGKLLSQNRYAGELLPPDSSKGCRCGIPYANQQCFASGDTRTNQHTPLMICQTIFLREHNHIAEILKGLNPHWDDEKLYQEARRILIAKWHVIIYKEYLPILLGSKLMAKYGLNMDQGSRYNPSIDPSISVEFNAAAFRIHSILPGKVVTGFDIQYLQHLYKNAIPVYADRMSSYLEKMAQYPGEKYDSFFPNDLTIWMYRELPGTWGFDLAAVDIQRGRDVGLPSYVEAIEYKKSLPPGTIKDYTDLENYSNLDAKCKEIFEKTYDDVRDIDFFSGIICEEIPDGMIISPTAADIIAEQFSRSKYGDRYFVQHDVTFNDAQRETLMNASLAKLLCDNSKIEEIQPNPMLLPNNGSNKAKPCSEISGVDIRYWKE